MKYAPIMFAQGSNVRTPLCACLARFLSFAVLLHSAEPSRCFACCWLAMPHQGATSRSAARPAPTSAASVPLPKGEPDGS